MKNPYAQQTKNHSGKEALVLEHAGLVSFLANRLAARLPDHVDKDDLIQAGMMGLLEAADKFDPTKGVQFKTFAELRIRGSMLDELRAKDWIPRSVRDAAHQLEKAYSRLRAAGHDNPTDKQLSQELALEPKELHEFIDKARPIPLLSIEGLGAASSDDGDMDFTETLTKPEDKDPITNLLGEEAQDVLQKALERLPEKEKLVLSLYYNEELNLKEIGQVLDITESRASQIRTKAIAQLRSYMSEFMAG